MTKKFKATAYLSMTLFAILSLWFMYNIFTPFDVLVVDDIYAYKQEEPFWHKYIYLGVFQQPFGNVAKPVVAGEKIEFDVSFIYNFGEPPKHRGLLKCEDNSVYTVPTEGKLPKIIGEPGVVTFGVSSYNIIVDGARGKECHLEFQTKYPLMFKDSILKTATTSAFLVE